MRRYEAYVDSEIEWVGEMPSHWKKIRHKNVFNKAQDIVGEDSSKYDVLSLTMRGVIKRDIESNIGKMPASFDGYQIVKPNSLLLCLFDIDVTPRCIGYVNQDGITTSAYTNIKVKNNTFYAKYYYYWFLMLDMDKTLLHLSKNLRNSIGITEFMALTTIYPPVNEQKKISCYLDKKIKEIDDTVALMNIYIEKVLENRQSIITEAVTKGLNPNVKMKDSGVEWIGEIPEHFEKTLIKYISDINMGQSPSSEDVNVLGDGLPFLQGNAEFGECYPTPKLFSTSINKQSKLNDILLSVRAPVGAMNISNQIFGIGRGLCSITPKIEMKFLWYWLIGYNEYLKSFSTGSTFEAISIDDIKNFVICVPEKNEQLEIVCFLDYKIGQIDNVKKQLKLQIQKLKEYRQSLIYEAVTGKIDVREMEREVSEVSEDGCGYIGEGV